MAHYRLAVTLMPDGRLDYAGADIRAAREVRYPTADIAEAVVETDESLAGDGVEKIDAAEFDAAVDFRTARQAVPSADDRLDALLGEMREGGMAELADAAETRADEKKQP